MKYVEKLSPVTLSSHYSKSESETDEKKMASNVTATKFTKAH